MPILSFRPRPTGGAAFVLRRDEVSVQAIAPNDGLFFVRVDLSEPGLVVSDLNPGSRDLRSAARALVDAASEAGRLDEEALTVRDVAPVGDLSSKTEEVRAILALFAGETGRSLADTGLLARRDRFDLVARFAGGSG